MLTKGDLIAIKGVVKGVVKEEISELRTELKAEMDKNTNDLVELISSGFNTHADQFDNHEQRIVCLEKASFGAVSS